LQRPLESTQYTSFDFTQELDDHHVLGSIGSVGDAYDCDDLPGRRGWLDSAYDRPLRGVLAVDLSVVASSLL
jgi:hypothetical protein